MQVIGIAEIGIAGCASATQLIGKRPRPFGPRKHTLLVQANRQGELFRLSLAMGATGRWNLDMSRAARETLANYAALSYYEVWLGGLEGLLLESGAVSADDLREGRMLQAPAAMPRVLDVAQSIAGRGVHVSLLGQHR